MEQSSNQDLYEFIGYLVITAISVCAFLYGIGWLIPATAKWFYAGGSFSYVATVVAWLIMTIELFHPYRTAWQERFDASQGEF